MVAAERSNEQQRIHAEYDRRAADAELRNRYGLFNAAQWAALVEKERHLLALLKRQGRTALWDQRILDVGCGNGYQLRRFVEMGAYPPRCVGIDLRPDRLEQGRERTCSPLLVADATMLPFPDASFDIVTQHMMLSSVLDPTIRAAIAAEMCRVLRPDGLIICYDFARNNPRNPSVIGLPLAEVRRLFPGRLDARRLTLAPPLARAIASRSLLLYELLARMGALCTHWLVGITD